MLLFAAVTQGLWPLDTDAQTMPEAELREAVSNARLATEAALARMDAATPVERALIRTLEQRYQSVQVTSHSELCAWNDAYAASMR
jgi:hypothetical protein